MSTEIFEISKGNPVLNRFLISLVRRTEKLRRISGRTVTFFAIPVCQQHPQRKNRVDPDPTLTSLPHNKPSFADNKLQCALRKF